MSAAVIAERIETAGDLDVIISSYGPFEIIGLLDSMSPNATLDLAHNISEQGRNSTLAHLTYYQKYLERFVPEFAQVIQQEAIGRQRRRIAKNKALPYSVSALNLKERNKAYKMLKAVQFSFGCEGRCSFCAIDAPLGLRDKVPLEQQIALLEEIGKHVKQSPSSFWANDILETVSNVAEFRALDKAYRKSLHQFISARTSIPRGTEELYKGICAEYPNCHVLHVSLSQENILRLHAYGIVKVSSLDAIKKWNRKNAQHDGIEYILYPEVLDEIFNKGLVPWSVSLKYEENLKSAGINRYENEERRYSVCFPGTIITPYGVHNVMNAQLVSRRYPQGQVVVAVDRLANMPINPIPGDRIEDYLRHAVITQLEKRYTTGYSYRIENLHFTAVVRIDDQGIIVKN